MPLHAGKSVWEVPGLVAVMHRGALLGGFIWAEREELQDTDTQLPSSGSHRPPMPLVLLRGLAQAFD